MAPVDSTDRTLEKGKVFATWTDLHWARVVCCGLAYIGSVERKLWKENEKTLEIADNTVMVRLDNQFMLDLHVLTLKWFHLTVGNTQPDAWSSNQSHSNVKRLPAVLLTWYTLNLTAPSAVQYIPGCERPPCWHLERCVYGLDGHQAVRKPKHVQ